MTDDGPSRSDVARANRLARAINRRERTELRLRRERAEQATLDGEHGGTDGARPELPGVFGSVLQARATALMVEQAVRENHDAERYGGVAFRGRDVRCLACGGQGVYVLAPEHRDDADTWLFWCPKPDCGFSEEKEGPLITPAGGGLIGSLGAGDSQGYNGP